MATEAPAVPAGTYRATRATLALRIVAWCIVTTLFAFLLNVYLTFWRNWPGTGTAFGDAATGLAWLQVGIYLLPAAAVVAWVMLTRSRSLRAECGAITAVASYIVRVAFWTVLLVGVVDAVISFLRVEGLLVSVVGEQMASDLGRSQYRGPYVHLPLIAASLVLAILVRSLSFHWLALLVVMAELQIVISRFVFSYEQAFMGDLVRLWYAGLFLFSSAYTLVHEGHVRVDVLYTGFSPRTKGLVNAVGAVLLGLPLCVVVLYLGFSQSTSIIASPLLVIETTQSGFGMYVKYLMAAFLAVFAGSMAVQFAAYLLEGVADFRGDPGKHEHDTISIA